MKILLLANHLNTGGITTYVLSLAEGLRRKGHVVKLASRGGAFYEKLTSLGIEQIYLDLNTKSEISPKIFLAKRKLLAILKDERVDILHAQTRLTRVLAQFVQNKLNIPFISTAHGFYSRRIGSRFFPCWGEGVIAVSQAVKRDLIAKFKTDSKKIGVIYNGIKIDNFNKVINDFDKCQVKKTLGLNSKRIIVSISRLSFIKGHIYLIKAMKKVLESYPGIVCLIIGEGEAGYILKQQVERLKLEKEVRFFKSVDDTGQILKAADLFVLPTLQEGLGLSILEAMASGVPVIATDTGGIPEMIESGKNGILFPPKDTNALAEAICRVLNDDALRNSLIDSAKKTVVEKFSSENMVNLTEGFYKNITGQLKK